MGAYASWSVVKYNPNVEAALRQLRDREFRAGRYNPVVPFIPFPIAAASPAPGARHGRRGDARRGRRRHAVDPRHRARRPRSGLLHRLPLGDDVLEDLYGTTRPTREAVEENMDFLEEVKRVHAVYVVLYRDGEPDGLLLAGYSFD